MSPRIITDKPLHIDLIIKSLLKPFLNWCNYEIQLWTFINLKVQRQRESYGKDSHMPLLDRNNKNKIIIIIIIIINKIKAVAHIKNESF